MTLTYQSNKTDQFGNSRILIVEDEVIIALYIENVLHKNNYSNTTVVSSGKACLEKLKEARTELILMDISLDGDMDGVETAQLINNDYDIPIIFLTAYSDDEVLQKAKRVNPYGYIIKPINAKELYAMVETSIYKHRLDNRLKESELKFRTLFEQSRDGIVLCDRNGTISNINRSMELMLGYVADELSGMHISDIFVENDDIASLISSLEECDFINDYEGQLCARDGKAIECSVTATAIRNDKGNLVGYQSIIRDITERKLLGKRIMDSVDKERERIGRDLHDGLGQILTGTGFLCELLIKKLSERNIPEKNNAEEILHLLNDAKEQTRNIARGLMPINIGEGGLFLSIKQLCLNIEQLFNIRCSFSCHVDLSMVDEIRGVNLYYIIMEAANNAVRHSSAGNIDITILQEDSKILLTIRDDGDGFAMEEHSDKEGLGFHIMKYRAGLIGATLNVDSMPTGGTVISCAFWINYPDYVHR